MNASEASGPAPVPLQAHREQTIASLCEHFSRDNLTVDEFERRLDMAHRVQTMDALNQLLQDLPALPPQPVSASRPAVQPAPPVTSHAREHQHFIAIMGGVDKRGAWHPAQKTYCYAMLGGGTFDYREALLPPGETELIIIAMMGGVEIIVPPHVRVDCDGVAIMGGFDHGPDMTTKDPNAPVLRVRGFCLMGGVEITVRNPGESARDARLRRKEEKKRLKRG